MNTPTNRQELKRAIYGAWGQYVATLKRLMIEAGRELGGLEAAHIVLGQPADDAYLQFQTDQAAIQHRFGQFFDSPHLVRRANEDYLRALHNVDALVDAAQFEVDQAQKQIDDVKSGKFSKYGITEPSEQELAAWDDANEKLSSAKGLAAAVRETEEAKLDAALAELEKIRPGVTDPGPKQPQEAPPLPSTPTQIIRRAMESYDGPMTSRGYPRCRNLTMMVGFRVSRVVRNNLWRAIQKEKSA